MFVLVVDGLNRMFVKAKEGGLLHGLPGSSAIAVTNLQYADDTLIFGCCDVGQACVNKCILACFERWSGLQINFHKSSLVNLGRRNTAFLLIQSIMGCKVQKLPITYLRIPERRGRLIRHDWAPILDKIENQLDGWKSRVSSLGGRLTLINSVLSAMPTYLMSCFIIPKWVRERIDKIRRRILWGGSDKPRRHYNLVALGQVCRPKRRGFGYSGLKDLQLGIHDQVVMEDLIKSKVPCNLCCCQSMVRTGILGDKNLVIDPNYHHLGRTF